MLYLGAHEVRDALENKVCKLLQLGSKILRAVLSDAFLPVLIVPYYVVLKSLTLILENAIHGKKN